MFMLANVGWIAVRIEHLARSLGLDALDLPAALGLAVLKLVQTVAFDHSAVLSAASDVLVLCSALAGILAGLALLRKQVSERAQ